MITVPIWVFVILVTLSSLFVVFIIVLLFCLMKISVNNNKEWDKIVEETYNKKNWQNGEK